MTASLYSVVTTIQPPTEAARQLVSRLRESGAPLIVIGDKKGPKAYELEGVEFLSLEDQLESEFELARKLPTSHYTRKNVGYLVALASGAGCIYETDDDNAPRSTWRQRQEITEAVTVEADGWVNVYRYFSEEKIWPRGFPLDALARSFNSLPPASEIASRVRAPIQQGLANNSPDVDAIWRLVLDRPFDFRASPSVVLPPGAWCPFNSQSTWWFPQAYPLMYLPSYCSFRMTDIWRSFVAQRCLWELDCGVVFHSSEVVQERNAHDLMRDFADEIPGYEGNRKFAEILDALPLSKGGDAVVDNMMKCYRALVQAQFFPETELDLVKAWLSDCGHIVLGEVGPVESSIEPAL